VEVIPGVLAVQLHPEVPLVAVEGVFAAAPGVETTKKQR